MNTRSTLQTEANDHLIMVQRPTSLHNDDASALLQEMLCITPLGILKTILNNFTEEKLY
jgi:hypothetical protein